MAPDRTPTPPTVTEQNDYMFVAETNGTRLRNHAKRIYWKKISLFEEKKNSFSVSADAAGFLGGDNWIGACEYLTSVLHSKGGRV